MAGPLASLEARAVSVCHEERAMRPTAAIPVVLLLLATACRARAGAAPSPPSVSRTPPAEAQLVAFAGPDGTDELRDFLYVPPGRGPFPAVLWNHGSERLPGWQPELARFYNGKGFVFFIPHRRGHGRSPGPHIGDRIAAIPTEMDR